ncbi:MAG: outer membrane beta-barrel protein [Gallionella sp.]
MMFLKLVFAAIAGLVLCIPAAQAANRGNNGAGSLEFNVPLNYMGYTSKTFDDGSSASTNAAFGLGFGMGYNFNDHFQVNGQFSWSGRNYKATVVDPAAVIPTQTFSNTLYTSTINVNAVYYFMSGDFTPFVSGGIGSTFLDSNIADPSGGSGGCYYYPYWGYSCYEPTKTSTNVSYNYGLGVRMDVNRGFAIEGSWNQLYIDTAQSESPKVDIWRANFIFRM